MSRVAAALCRFLSPPADRRTDGALLSAFLREQDEAAFEELVRRHGPLVWGLCRRALPDPADAEDAFQAAFLVLVRRANRLTGQATVGPWLYKVAAWTARNLRRRNARQLARRVPLPPDTPDHAPGTDAADLAADLDAALLALPEKYRTPLILCHLQGWSRRDAAERLRVPEGTLSALLSRGLAKLRDRLAGHDPVKALGAGSAVVPLVLVAATARTAGAARLALTGTVSASVSQLVEGVLHMFWVQKATAASLGLVVVFGLGLGVGISVQQVPRAAADDTAPTVKAPAPADATADSTDEEQLADLRKKLDIHEAHVREAGAGAKLTEAKLKLTATQFAEGKLTADAMVNDTDTLRRFKQQLIEAEKQRADLIAKIQALESKRAAAPRTGARPATQPPPSNPAEPKAKQPRTRKPADPPAGANPFRVAGEELAISDQLKQLHARLQELEAMQRKLQAERAQVQAEAERIRAMAEIYAQEQKIIAARAKDNWKEKIADTTGRGTVRDKITAAQAGGHLEVVVGGADAWWPCWVKEYGADGKPVGSVVCDSVPMLARYLGRAAGDAKAPKDVHVSVQSGAGEDRTKAVVEACKAAGFRNVQVGGRSGAGSDLRLDIRLEKFDKDVIIEFDRRKAPIIDLLPRGGAIKEKEEALRELQRAAEQALKNEQRARDEAIRALQEAEKRLQEEIKKQPERTRPEPQKPQPPKDTKKSKNPDGDD